MPLAAQESSVLTIDPAGLLLAAHHFNPTILQHRGRLLFCYRHERQSWQGHSAAASIALAELDRWTLRPSRHLPVVLSDRAHREDPRLFHWRGRPCISYCCQCRQHVIELDAETLEVLADRIAPAPFPTQPEKNWGFFEVDGELHCVYRWSPLIIFRLDRATLRPREIVADAAVLPWAWGEIRGGTPPVPHNGELWSFFHSSMVRRADPFHGWARYFAGVAVMSARVPFRLLRVSAAPVLAADDEPTAGEGPTRSAVVFPGGAIRRGDGWLVAAGWNDRECRLLGVSDAEIEAIGWRTAERV